MLGNDRTSSQRSDRGPLWRWSLVVSVALMVTTVAALLVLPAGPPPATRRAASGRHGVPEKVRATRTTGLQTTTTTATSVPTTTTTTTDPGMLPQTDDLPPASTPQFAERVAALWQGVVSGQSADALPAFFPESAYQQLKAVADPMSDYEDRLVAQFVADVDAAHALLGADASTATQLGVDVPESYAHWVPPGVCDNRIGYYEVANSRVVYQEDGTVRSFGIASLISWRGEWYVVHLGAVVRSTPGGVVEDPDTGAGSSPDSATC